MPTAEEVLFSIKTNKNTIEPPPFQVDDLIDKWVETKPKEQEASLKDSIAKTLFPIVRPFLAVGYSAPSALTRGMANMATHFDMIDEWASKKTGGILKSKLDWEGAAERFEKDSEFWKERAKKVGANALDEFVGEFLGGAIPGIAEFSIGLTSGLTYPYTVGAAQAEKQGQNEVIGGLVEAMKTGTLGAIFKMIMPLRQYLRAPIMGTVFGTQAAIDAPEGERFKEFGKGMAIGAGYSMMSPGGQLGLNELIGRMKDNIMAREIIRPEVDIKEEIKPIGEGEKGKGIPTVETQKPEGGVKDKILQSLESDQYEHDLGQGLHYGLRVIPSRYKTPKIGDILPRSFQWKGDIRTNKKMEGTSVVGISPETVDQAIRYLHNPPEHQYAGETIALVKGKLLGEGNDIGERIFSNPEVVAIFKKSDLPIKPKEVTFQDFLDATGRKRIYDGEPGFEELVNDFETWKESSPVSEGVVKPSELKPEAKTEGIKPTHVVTIEGFPEEHPAIVTKNTVPGEKPWRVTYFEPTGELIGHLDMETTKDYPTEFLSGEGKLTKVSVRPIPQEPKVAEVKPSIGEVIGKPKEGEPEAFPRKFLKTAEESEFVNERTKEILRDIQTEEPQIYYKQGNPESREMAIKRIERDGIEESEKYAYSDSPMNAEKAATFEVLRERFEQNAEWNRAVNIIDAFDSQVREAGRFVQYASVYTRGTPQGFIRWAEKQINKINEKRTWLDNLTGSKKSELTKEDKIFLTQKLIEINKMPDGVEKENASLEVIDFVASKVPPGISEMIDAYRYQNMLSGFQTQERNIFGNMTNTFVTRPWTIATTGGIDFVKSRLFGKERESYVKDVLTYYKSTINAVPNATNAFIQAFKLKTIIEKPEVGIEAKNAFELARARQMPKALTGIQRFMEGSDRFNSVLISAGEYAIQKQRGVPETEALKNAQELAKKYLYRDKLDPSDPSLSLFSKALEGLGRISEEARQIPTVGKAFGYVVPFIRTPIKLGVMNIEYSPLGAIRKGWTNEAIAKLTMAGIVSSFGAMASYVGETTWTAPEDPKEKEWFYATGRKPFSVKLGNRWVSMWYLGPFALAFAIPTAIKYHVEESKQSLTTDQFEKLFKIAESTIRFLGSQTSVQSIGNFFAWASGDIDFTAAAQSAFTAGQMIPAQGFLRWVNKIIDPIYRKAEGFWENIEKDLPVLSKEIQERKTPFMEPSERDFLGTILPWDVSSVKEEYESIYPVIQLDQRIKYLDSQFDKIMKDMTLGEKDPEKQMKEIEKIFESYPKLFD